MMQLPAHVDDRDESRTTWATPAIISDCNDDNRAFRSGGENEAS